jgi:PAS domain S-box-containing protein
VWLATRLRPGGVAVRGLIAELAEPALLLDGSGHVRSANAAAAALLGGLLGRPDRRISREDLVQHGVRLEQFEAARAARATGAPWSGDIAFRVGDRVRRLELSMTAAPGGDTLLLARDATDTVEAQRRLHWDLDRQQTVIKGLERQLSERTVELTRISEQYFQLFDTAPAFYLHLDDRLRILLINTPGAESLGYEAQELHGRLVAELFEADERPRLHDYLRAIGGTGSAKSEEFRLLSRTRQVIPVLASAAQVPDPTGAEKPGIRLALVDIGTLKEHQTLLRRISAELEERNAVLELKNEEIARADRLKSEFLDNVSHELRTPLHAIIGYSELIHSGGYGPTTDLQRHGAAGIIKRGEDLRGLIDNLLDLSRIEAGRMDVVMAPYDPVAAVQKPLETSKMLVRKKTELQLRLAVQSDLPRLVTGDEDMYGRIIMNLLSNASRFTERGSIVVSLSKEGSRFVTSVADTGIGMSQESLHLIFDEFRQVDGSTTRKHGGSGLGLAICRKLCNLMGGEITVTSQVGVGTTFYVKLPIHGEEADARSRTREWTRHETTISR